MKRKKIGVIVAIETEAVFEMYPDYVELAAPPGFKLYYVGRDNYELFILRSGMGEIYAASGVQYLITRFKVKFIFNFGVVGGLTDDMKKHKVCIVEDVVHYKYDCSEFMNLLPGQVDGHKSIYLPTNKVLLEDAISRYNLTKVTCCSGDKFISTATEKKYLHETFKGHICDMESAGIVLTCEINNIPCILLKAVSDGLLDGAEGFYKELQNAALKCLEVAVKIIEVADI